MLVTHHTGKIQ